MQAFDKSGNYNEFQRIRECSIIRGGRTIKLDFRQLYRDGSIDPMLQAGDLLIFR